MKSYTQTKYSSFSRKFKLIYSNGGWASTSSQLGRGSWDPTEENLWQIVCIVVPPGPHPIFTGYQSVILTLILGGDSDITQRGPTSTVTSPAAPVLLLLLLSPLILRESVRCRIGVNFLLLGQITSLYNEDWTHYQPGTTEITQISSQRARSWWVRWVFLQCKYSVGIILS